jgi:hypothetical protein
MEGVLKNTALGLCVALGRRLRIPGLSVLVYHSIDDSSSYMSTSAGMFRAQMEWLRDHGFRAISMRQVFERGTAEFPPERTVVLTFDDGLANFAETAWPVLRDMSFSATAIRMTDFTGRTPPGTSYAFPPAAAWRPGAGYSGGRTYRAM